VHLHPAIVIRNDVECPARRADGTSDPRRLADVIYAGRLHDFPDPGCPGVAYGDEDDDREFELVTAHPAFDANAWTQE